MFLTFCVKIRVMNWNKNKGFTLIELLVVIAIISLLSSVVLASLNSARAKSRDAKRKEDFHTMQLAFQLYYDKYKVMPLVPAGGGPEVCEYLVGTTQYVTFMNDMIAAGALSGILKSPGTQGWGRGYCYYDYGSNNAIGALFVTDLEASPATSTGDPGSCRYTWGGGNVNWCNTNTAFPSTQYCICNTY